MKFRKQNQDSIKIGLCTRDAPRGGAGGAAAPPDFGRSEGRAAAARRITTCPPGYLTRGASLNYNFGC